MSEWKECKLAELAEITMGQSPIGETCNTISEGVPLLNGPTEFSVKYPFPVQYTVDPKKLSKIGDILFCVRGSTTGKMNWSDREYAIGRGLAAIRHKHSKKAQYFIKGILDYNLPLILGGATGSTFPNVSGEELKNLIISVPDLVEQEEIAELLGSLNDKIDLLYRQNKILEELAETLFRQWFVEEAEDSWVNGKLNDVLALEYGKTLKEETRSGKGFPVIGSSGIVGYHSEYLIESPGIVIGRKGTLGKVNYQFDNFYPIDTTFYIKSKVQSKGLYYEYFLLKHLDLKEMNSDSAVPGLNRDIAHSLSIFIPPINKISEFNNVCLPYFQKIKSNSKQIKTLTKLRDELLPKLMSGTIELKSIT